MHIKACLATFINHNVKPYIVTTKERKTKWFSLINGSHTEIVKIGNRSITKEFQNATFASELDTSICYPKVPSRCFPISNSLYS